MTFLFPDGLAPEVYPLAWLVGSWEGVGVVEYPGIDRTQIRARVEFDHDGGPYLTYTAILSLMGTDGEEGNIWSRETGFWRVPPSPPPDLELTEGQYPVEVLLTDASGTLSLFIGTVGNGRIDLGTDLMARSASAPEVGGATRLYGNVNGELLWAWDIAAFGNPLQSYASGRLERVDAPVVGEE